jgi:flavin-dependent dehydrogenase
LVERYKTPRIKPCSGIQFRYFEKLLGARIPSEKLCSNKLYKVEMIIPSEKVLKGKMEMLNFWRDVFDSWLNSLAADAGAEFFDHTRVIDFMDDEACVSVKLLTQNTVKEVRARYLIGADGMLSTIRRRLRPQDFDRRASGATVNYYFVGEANLDPNTLYMFYRKEFSPLMFAWVYLKDDKWVIGTGANENPLHYAKAFFDYVKERYRLRGEVVRREGFSSTLKSIVYFGGGNVLLVGDAAGLVDLYRGVGMDNAALSGRLAVKALIKAEEKCLEPAKIYGDLMKKVKRKIEISTKKQMKRLSSNEELERSFSPISMLKGGLLAEQLNKLPHLKTAILTTLSFKPKR